MLDNIARLCWDRTARSDDGDGDGQHYKLCMWLRDGNISVCGGIICGHVRCNYDCLLEKYRLLKIYCDIIEDQRVEEDFAVGGHGNGNGDGNTEYFPFHLLFEPLVRGQLDV